MVSVVQRKPKWTPSLFLTTLFAALLILTGCGKQPTPQAPSEGTATGFEFAVNPQTEQVTLTEATDQAQAQATPSDSRILVPNVDLALRNLSFEFQTPKKLVVYFQLENITTELDFAQPFFFTLSSESDNLERANAPLVTDAQLGGDGVLSHGETSQRFRLEAVFKKGEPFTFLVNANAVVTKGTSPAPSCTNPVNIPDEYLESSIRDELGKPGGNLTCADLESLTSLRGGLTFEALSKLEGLQYAVNLTSLDLTNNIIQDLTPLQNLDKLTVLELGQNAVSDLTPLQNLVGLKELGLIFNGVSDLTPLQNLTSLEILNLGYSYNTVSDITPLKDLTQLDGTPTRHKHYQRHYAATKPYQLDRAWPQQQPHRRHYTTTKSY